jgi:hypothetical protein
MVRSKYFPSITELFLAHPPMYLTTWKGGPDAASSGGGTLTKVVRCPFETFWRSGADGGVSVEEPGGESSRCLLVARILVRYEAP